MLECKFCTKQCKNDNSLRNHERLCKQNPERQYTPFQDKKKQKEIALIRGNKNQWSNSSFACSEETRIKLSSAAKVRNQNESIETKEKRKTTIARKVSEGTWHTSLAKNHHYKYNGCDLHGKWELRYATWLDQNNIKWERCKETFGYIFNGKKRRYTPDFYLEESDEYVEIKGYKTEKDEAKWSQFPSYRKLKILRKEDLESLGIKIDG